MQNKTEPRIILWDLETLPDMEEAMEHWCGLGAYPGLTLKAQISSIICFGWKVFGKDHKAKVDCAWDFKTRWARNVNDDYMLCKHAQRVLSTADAIVTWNGKKFDERHLRTRLEHHGLPPLPPFNHHIDLRQVSSKKMYFFNNKLMTVSEWLLEVHKREHEGWKLWVKTRKRDPAAMKTMKWYCEGDVLALESAYRRLRKFNKDTPNHNLFTIGERCVCPTCGGTRLKSHGWRYTQTSRYQQFFCKDCGSFGRTDKNGKNPRAID
jgi:hypothetical protein